MVWHIDFVSLNINTHGRFFEGFLKVMTYLALLNGHFDRGCGQQVEGTQNG